MALDKQRILNDLGNVVNQLQSADCGCLGNIFSPGQNSSGQPMMGSPLPTCGGCRRGICQGHGYGGYGAACAGDSMNMNMNRPCMGRCNPSKLYADTYGYLNQNLMQPVVKEVYDDLRSITPANTIANNPMANQMGLTHGNAGNPMMQGGNMGGISNQNQPGMGGSNAMQGMGGMAGGPGMNNPNSPMGGMGGMGAQIMNMMMSGGGGRPKVMPPQGQVPDSMPDASNAPHGHGGMTPMLGGAGNPAMSMEQGDLNANQTQHMGQRNMNAQMMNPPTQFATDNSYTVGNAQMNPASGAGNMARNMNPAALHTGPQIVGGNLAQNLGSGGPQMNANAIGNVPKYGQHTPGMNKFNEMFPGLIQGDLGFDPMAIAMQMNPANQQRAAMDSMQKIMNNKMGTAAANLIEPTGGHSNLIQNQALNQQTPQQNVAGSGQQNPQQVNPGQQQIMPVQQQIMPNQAQVMPGQQQVISGQQDLIQGQQTTTTPNTGTGQLNQQQVYTAVTGGQQFQGEQQVIDPNAGDVAESHIGYEESADDPNAQSQPQTRSEEMYKEPIFPADTSRYNALSYQSRYPRMKSNYPKQYNTLGQPVELVPGHLYNVPIPNLPQTLSPRTPSRLKTNVGKFGVKSTVSKTALAGMRPVGKTPSRNQLQQIYQQYKTPQSNSYTRQNIKAPVQGGTMSVGRLYAAPVNNNPQQLIPVEKVGGDTIANNQMNNNIMVNKAEMGQIGDVPVSQKPQVEGEIQMSRPMKPHRNGLQDIVYTSYPSNAAWSFHGDYRPPMATAYYRPRNTTRMR